MTAKTVAAAATRSSQQRTKRRHHRFRVCGIRNSTTNSQRAQSRRSQTQLETQPKSRKRRDRHQDGRTTFSNDEAPAKVKPIRPLLKGGAGNYKMKGVSEKGSTLTLKCLPTYIVFYLCICKSLFVAQIKVSRGGFICATNRLFFQIHK